MSSPLTLVQQSHGHTSSHKAHSDHRSATSHSHRYRDDHLLQHSGHDALRRYSRHDTSNPSRSSHRPRSRASESSQSRGSAASDKRHHVIAQAAKDHLSFSSPHGTHPIGHPPILIALSPSSTPQALAIRRPSQASSKSPIATSRALSIPASHSSLSTPSGVHSLSASLSHEPQEIPLHNRPLHEIIELVSSSLSKANGEIGSLPRNIQEFLRANGTKISRLMLSDCFLRGHELESITQAMPNLQIMIFKRCEVTDVNLGFLPNLTSLRAVGLCGCTINNGGFFAWALNIKKLDHFSVYKCEGANLYSFFNVDPLPQLLTISFGYCSELTNENLGRLARIAPRLTKLSLCQCEEMNEKGYVFLQYFKNLTSLSLQKSPNAMKPKVFTVIGNLPHLKVLNLSRNENLSDASFRFLQPAKQLEIIHIEDCPHVLKGKEEVLNKDAMLRLMHPDERDKDVDVVTKSLDTFSLDET